MNARNVIHSTTLGMLLLLVAVSFTGCAAWRSVFGDPEIVIPKADTAREQAQLAERQYTRAQQTVDPEMRRTEFRKAVAAFSQVVDSFPLDRIFTPPSHLMKADIYRELKEFKKAETTYREVISLYPDIADVHSRGLYGLGETLYELKRVREGKDAFRRLIDTYAQNNDEQIRYTVRRGRARYEEIL